MRLLLLTLACIAALAAALPAAADPVPVVTPTPTPRRAATPTPTRPPAPTATLASVSVISASELSPETEEITLTRGGQTVTRRVLKTERTADGREVAAGRVVVRFRDGTDGTTRNRVHADAATRATGGAPVAGRTARVAPLAAAQRQVVELPAGASLDAAVSAYRSDPRVVSAEPDYVMRTRETPNDPSFSAQWGLEKIGAATAWNVTHGTSATIAILDCGIYEAAADRKSTRLNSSHKDTSRMPSSA